MLRVITLNLNGIRSAARKGFFAWLERQDADVVCLQEIKAQAGDLDDTMLAPAGFHASFHCAEKKGYSGVAIYSRRKPKAVTEGLGLPEFDREGRYLRSRFRRLLRGIAVSAVRFQFGGAAAGEVPLSRAVLAAAAPVGRRRPGRPAVRRLEHRPQGDRSEELAREPEELRLPAGGTGMDRQGIRRHRLGGRLPSPESGHPSNTPGGPTAARPGPET